MDQNEQKKELNAEVAKAFTLAPGAPAVFENRRHGTIDISTVTPEQVAALIDGGCKHFIKKEAETAPKVKA